MIRTLLFFFLFSSLTIGYSQNLVPNPGFEQADYTSRLLNKTGREFERQAVRWTVPNQASTDLLSPRFNSTNLTTIPPHSGDHMAGIVTNGTFWAEYVGVKLKQPLVPGTQYYVEFWVSMPRYYSKKKPVPTFLHPQFGMLFSNKIFQHNKEIVKGNPQINAGTETFVEPEKWTKVTGTYAATESATHLYIGQFWDEEVKPELAIGYFFIDDVFVQAFKSTAIQYEPSRYYNISGSVASVIMDNIYFETDKYNLLDESYKELNKLVGIMEKNPSLTIQIQGHTDSQGAERYNVDLSKNRAKAVREYLVGQGIAESRLSSKGFGDKRPVADNQSDTGRQRNRRVEFVINGNIPADELNQGPGDVYRFAESIPQDDWLSRTFTQPFAFRDICLPIDTEGSASGNKLLESKPVSARTYILDQSNKQYTIFMNEQVSNPQNRAFVTGLLPKLYEQGYRYLALEALSPKETKLSERGYPVLNSGRLTREPLFGDLIRQAVSLGFTLYAFEPTPHEMRKATAIIRKGMPADADPAEITTLARNWAKAMNIARIYRKDADAKVLVYCSQPNLREDLTDDKKTIAGWFKALSGIDPLTVEQATMTEQCKEQKHPLFGKKTIGEPTVFLNRGKPFNSFGPDAVDIQLFYPTSVKIHGRPNWQLMNGYRKPLAFNPDMHGMDYPCLVLAYQKGEDPDFAVPVDALEFRDANVKASLLLPVGNYMLILSDEMKHKQLEVVAGD